MSSQYFPSTQLQVGYAGVPRIRKVACALSPCLVLQLSLVLFCYANAFGVELRLARKPVPADATIVPQNLLNLVHAREVQSELGLSNSGAFRSLLEEIDRQWLTSRMLSKADQRRTFAAMEERLIHGLEPIIEESSRQRLLQIELQSQGWRMLARPDLVDFLQLTVDQQNNLKEIFDRTDAAATFLAKQNSPNDKDRVADLQKLKAAENLEAPRLLNSLQQASLKKALGKLVDTSKYQRIYPLAPELVDSGYWAGGTPTSLKQLRGKVVLLHFYAFQCHNCVANFDHYRRWHEQLSKKGVQVIGIQTPETKAESDPAKVTQAALKERFEFPVLIDLKRANWDAWGNSVWPTVYVVDQEGYIRLWYQGELNWQGATGDKTIEKMVDQLLVEYAP